MKQGHFRRGLLVVALVAISGSMIAAQNPPPQDPQSQGQRQNRGARQGGGANALAQPQRPAQAMNDVQDMFDTLVLARAQGALQLNDTQYPQFFRAMRDLQQLRRRHQMQRQRMLNELRKFTNPQNPEPVDDATFDARVKSLDDLELQMFQEEKTKQAAVDAVLTPRQRAHFRIFEENMEREKLRMLAKALQTSSGQPQGPAKEIKK